ncbi:MAG: 3-deoxy-7-phosphoheptulonate synthase [Eubacterium sp.]|nr:3-deoxy-7-phosphoheptulonate synthase [Eubacterium sp.]
MIIVMKPNAAEQSVNSVLNTVKENGLRTHRASGETVTIIGVVGDKTKLDTSTILSMNEVEKIVNVTESYKLVNKKFHPAPTVIKLPYTTIGPDSFTVMAGPCAIESREQIHAAAKAVRDAGATMLRGGAFKPRTSPYSFQGLEEEGLKYIQEAARENAMDTICEVTSEYALELAVKYVDMVQIGARNMQNFELLKEVGRSGIPVMLKRGLSSTIDEWLNAAEYIMSYGNPNVALCERGIRTFETATRNTLDLSAVCVLKEKTHLPVIVDPSHATGVRAYVEPLSKAALITGADGIIVEVHPNPPCALSDGPQSLYFEQFDKLMKDLAPIADLTGRTLH